MKKRMLLLALLFCGQSLLAGGRNHRAPTQGVPVGFVRPALGVFAEAFGRICSYAQGEDSENAWELNPEEDDDNDLEDLKAQNEERLRDRTPDEFSELERLPAEVIIRLFTYLDDETLFIIARTSRRLYLYAQNERNNRFFKKAIRFIRSVHQKPKEDSVKIIGNLLAAKSLCKEQRVVLLEILMGEDGQGGLVNDPNPYNRVLAPGILGIMLASDALNTDEREIFLSALMGASGQGGLISDPLPVVRCRTLQGLRTILMSGASHSDVRKRALNALVRKDGQGGLINDQDYGVQGLATMDVKSILASGVPDEDERLRLGSALFL